jgi:hypothetical protein
MAVDPVVKTVDPITTIPDVAVMLQHFASVHRKGEQKIRVQILNYWFHGARFVYNR